MPKYAAKVDANQPEIVDALRAAGYTVDSTLYRAGQGWPDIAVSRKVAGTKLPPLLLVEIKVPGKGKLTSAERAWFEQWPDGIPAIVATSAEDVMAWFDEYEASQ